MAIPDIKLRKTLLSYSKKQEKSQDGMTKDDLLKYIRERLCSLIVSSCLEGKSKFLFITKYESREELEDDIKFMISDFSREGITLKVVEKKIDYGYKHYQYGSEFFTVDRPAVVTYCIKVKWE